MADNVNPSPITNALCRHVAPDIKPRPLLGAIASSHAVFLLGCGDQHEKGSVEAEQLLVRRDIVGLVSCVRKLSVVTARVPHSKLHPPLSGTPTFVRSR